MRTKKPDSNARNRRKRFRMVKPPWTCSKGQFYTYRLPNKTLWFQRIRQRMGFAERCGNARRRQRLVVEEFSAGESSVNRTKLGPIPREGRREGRLGPIAGYRRARFSSGGSAALSPAIYSWRSARTGSAWRARRAGIQVAVTPPSATSAKVAAIPAGSDGETW